MDTQITKTRELANFHYISLTDQGCVRENNEDYLGYFDTINGHVFVVCDGCGGLPCGEKASQTVVNSLKFFFSNFYYKDPFQAIKDAFDYAQNRMQTEEENDTNCYGMATTVVLVLIRYNKAYYAHVGDSRIYYFSHRNFVRLTKDDSYVQKLVDLGEISEEEAENHPRKNELTRVMGMKPFCKPHICKSPIDPNDGDLLLLCTDGLYNMVKENDLKATLARRGYIEDKGMDLMKSAKNNGGFDNITLQIIKFYNVDYEKTGQKPIDSRFSIKKTNSLLIILAAVVIFMAGIIFALKYNKSRKNEQKTEEITRVEFDLDSLECKDSVLKIFGLKDEDVQYEEISGKHYMSIPVKKIIIIRYYDNIYTLSKLYGVSVEKLLKVNALKNKQLEPGDEFIIP
ncbi:MAG: protein phosphatase 2C domain-containing protein [Bacteroidales bacterium]|jgi:serine/threonine protein phosphatase PrpC|nr:protein phosphatase 2C domain-containing protein [Bacteroidales bacterium]